MTVGQTPTGPGTGNTCNCEELAAAKATIAAQATRIAELEAGDPPTPPAASTPSMTPAGTDSGSSPGTGNGNTPATDFITPDPTECTTTPRSAEEFAVVVAESDPGAADSLTVAMVTPGLEIPAGQPADEVTTAAIVATYREMTACINAGNLLAVYALWSDWALRQIQVEPIAGGAPTPIPEGEREAFRVTQIRALPDGRVVAVWEERGPGIAQAAVQILIRDGERYLVDETVDLASSEPSSQ